jgi:Protein of unknown function (DUF3251)
MRWLLFALFVTGVACDGDRKRAEDRLAALETRVAELDAQSKAAQVQVAGLDSRLVQAERDVFDLKMKSDPYEYAVFTPATSGYARIDTVAGNFLVSVSDFKPYANGYRLIAQVGNPHAATYANVKVKLRWGKPFVYADKIPYDQWEKGLRTAETTIASVRPGQWTRTALTLSPANAEETGYVSIALETNRVELYNPR